MSIFMSGLSAIVAGMMGNAAVVRVESGSVFHYFAVLPGSQPSLMSPQMGKSLCSTCPVTGPSFTDLGSAAAYAHKLLGQKRLLTDGTHFMPPY